MGRPRRFKNPKQLEQAWEDYKTICDTQTVTTHGFSTKNSEFVSAELLHPITYTIEGFCAHYKIARAAFYQNYANDDKFADTVTHMREDCEVDARKKFELQILPSQLAGLWMSKYGYTTKIEQKADVTLQEEQGKLNDLIAQLHDGEN